MPQELWDAIGYVEMYEKGLPPVAGGSLDQASWFTQAARFIWSEESRCKNKDPLDAY